MKAIFLLVIAFLSHNSFGCSCGQRGVMDVADKAKNIIVAKVINAREEWAIENEWFGNPRLHCPGRICQLSYGINLQNSIF